MLIFGFYVMLIFAKSFANTVAIFASGVISEDSDIKTNSSCNQRLPVAEIGQSRVVSGNLVTFK